jgi:hypothetical protein
MRKRLSPNGHIDNETKDLLDGLLAVQIAASDRVVPIQRWDIVSMDDLPPSLKGFLDPDMYSLMPGFELTPTIVQQQLPITITYRQPLNFQRGESHFFYVPSLPKGSGSKRYSITVAAAPGYSISVSNGVSPAFVKDGQVTILPRDGVPIRASVRPLANEHHAADGSQPFSPAAVRESLPAGSHR